jgi:serpin B
MHACIWYVKPGAAVKTINEWVKKATDNLVDSIVSTSNINADTDLVLANVIYFKGDWMELFLPLSMYRGGPRLEHRRKFHLLDRGHVEAEFMGGLRWLDDIACMDRFKIVKLPLQARRH